MLASMLLSEGTFGPFLHMDNLFDKPSMLISRLQPLKKSKIKIDDNRIKYKQLYKNKKLSIRKTKKWGHVYAHEQKCDGRLVALIPYSYDENGRMLFLFRSENVIPWKHVFRGEGKHFFTMIHGMMDDPSETPLQTAMRELKEEGGYSVEANEFISLGSIPISKAEDSVYYLYAVKVPGEHRVGEVEKGKGDGTKNENDAYCFWSSNIGIAVDPLAYTMYFRFMRHMKGKVDGRIRIESVEPIGRLSKGLYFEDENHSPLREESMYLSVNELSDEVVRETDSRFYKAYRAIGKMFGLLEKASEEDLPFSLGERQFFNIATGKPLTRAEWKRIEEAIVKVFGWVFEGSPEMIVQQAMALGQALVLLGAEESARKPLSEIKPQEIKPPELQYGSSLAYAHEAAASYITELTDDAREGIKQTIVNAARGKWTPKYLETELFDQFAELNRDWRRIAETELQTNFQTGFLIATGERSKEEGRTRTFVMGHSSPTACRWCWQNINGKVFVLVDSPPLSGEDTVDVDGKNYIAVWPGKSNIGRTRDSWWECIPSHPNCRCSYTHVDERFLPEFEEFEEGITEEKQEERNKLAGMFRET